MIQENLETVKRLIIPLIVPVAVLSAILTLAGTIFLQNLYYSSLNRRMDTISRKLDAFKPLELHVSGETQIASPSATPIIGHYKVATSSGTSGKVK